MKGKSYQQLNTPNYYYINIYLIRIVIPVLFLIALLFPSGVLAQNQADIQLANEYLIKGDKKKAAELYAELSKSEANIPLIHNNYFNLLLDAARFDDAQTYLKKLLRRDPDNLQYRLDVGLVYVRSGDLARAEKHFRDISSQIKGSIHMSKMMSDYLSSKSLFDYAVMALENGRSATGSNSVFALELAMLYRLKGEQDKMVNEYLNYVITNSGNLQYVKNVMQALLTRPEELQSLERLLYDRVQQFPDTEVYADLLIWVTMQQKNFYASFIQARAYDKRYKTGGEKCMEVARVSLDNEDFDNATKIYRYIIREFPESSNFLLARLGLIRTREARIKTTYPVNKDSVAILVNDYSKFIREFPDNQYALDAQRNKALLLAYHLDEKDSAINMLNNLVANPRASVFLKSKSRIDLGDMYLLRGEPWESTLLYAQVEKIQKENPVGYEAKLKNAKLSFYKGNFQLAQEHLDILKEATTREISNDAMDLSLLIKENIALDSSGEALQAFAEVQLLLFQNKSDQALGLIDQLKQGTIDGQAISNQTILDDTYWLEADLRMKRGEFEKAIALLEKIEKDFPDDVLADDSFFKRAEIYERQLKDSAKAMELYREFLNRYPGSVYAAEARKRYRTLRGDFNEQPNP